MARQRGTRAQADQIQEHAGNELNERHARQEAGGDAASMSRREFLAQAGAVGTVVGVGPLLATGRHSRTLARLVRSAPNPNAHRTSTLGSAMNLSSDVNSACHVWTGQMLPQNQWILGAPRVFAVYWDPFFVANPTAAPLMDQFFKDILSGGAWIDGLAQYGIQHGSFLGSVVVNKTAPTSLTRDQLVLQQQM